MPKIAMKGIAAWAALGGGGANGGAGWLAMGNRLGMGPDARSLDGTPHPGLLGEPAVWLIGQGPKKLIGRWSFGSFIVLAYAACMSHSSK